MTYSVEFHRQASWSVYQEPINIDNKQPKLEERTVERGFLFNSLQERTERLHG